MQNKKFYIILSLIILFAFSTKAIASLTFTNNTIVGTAASTIDVGSGNTLSLQTTNNGNVVIGTGVTSLGGALVDSQYSLFIGANGRSAVNFQEDKGADSS